MGCGLRKLDAPEDSSPGKIFSTLKRPQVETKAEVAYEYVLLDFTLQASSPSPGVIAIHALPDIATKVEEYYLKGYVVGAIHPVLPPVGQRRHLPASHLYRAVLWRRKPSPKLSAAPSGQRRPRLVIEEWPLTCETQANDVAKELIEKVNEASKRGRRFVGLLAQHSAPPCNGAALHGGGEPAENGRSWSEGAPGGGQPRESAAAEGEARPREPHGSPGAAAAPGEDNKLYMVFNAFDGESAGWAYQEGALSMKVTRKGPVVSSLDADWLELTTFYYKQGLSLIDSFVCWEAPKGDHAPKALGGFFVFEEEEEVAPGPGRAGKDAVVVEQWTVIEGCEIKTDYAPLLHTLAEFGWLLTSVLPTPILRQDSEGNLATKQVVFLQRPATRGPAAQAPERKASRHAKGEDRHRLGSRSVGLDTATSPPADHGAPPGGAPPPSRAPWLPGPAGPAVGLPRDLDDAALDQEDGVTQVTCM